MTSQTNAENDVKLFKNGNSYAFRVSKHDRESLKADGNTPFKKTISEDGNSVTFTKIEKHHPSLLETANKLYDQNEPLMKRLEKL